MSAPVAASMVNAETVPSSLLSKYANFPAGSRAKAKGGVPVLTGDPAAVNAPVLALMVKLWMSLEIRLAT